ncbi:MAG: phosphate ABC transporter substrate-binding protein [Elusimicrobiota bacterium]
MRKKITIMLAIIFMLSPVIFSFSAKEKITITGSSTVAPLMVEIGKRFESFNKDVRVDVQSGGSSRGMNDVRQSLADIGMVSRALKSQENDLIPFPVALDGVCVILNTANPVTTLSDEQIVKIYTGEIKNWKEVGGKNVPITVVNKAEGRSTLELFCHYYKLDNKNIKAQVVIGENEQGIKMVAGNPHAIGYVSIGAAEYNAEHNIPIKLLSVGGVKASLESVKNKTFPISRPLNLIVKSQPQGLVKAFIEFAQSQNVHDIIQELYFVPLSK